jgi:hypothetical protein
MRHPRWQPFSAALLRGCLFCILSISALAQRGPHSSSLSVSLNEDTRIFLNPQSPDPVERQRTEQLGTAVGVSGSWRYRVYPSISVDLRGEYIVHESRIIDQIGTPFTHGLSVFLLETSALFSLPFSSERFDLYVGGGLGLYSGRRLYSVANVDATHVSASPAIGIQVIVGAEYLLVGDLGIRFELLFRDPQMGVENRFHESSVTSRGVTYPLHTEPFRSNINLNGNVYSLGLFYSF